MKVKINHKYLWRTSAGDIPVRVVSYAGLYNNVEYYMVRGLASDSRGVTGVPRTELFPMDKDNE